MPTEALVADVLVVEIRRSLPLYRQAQILAREGVNIDRSTLCHWVGFAAVELEPLHARLTEILKASSKLFCDETRCPVLDPGRGKTKTGYLWAIARDDRPWGAAIPRRRLPATRPDAAASTHARCSRASAARCRSTAMPATMGCRGDPAGRCGRARLSAGATSAASSTTSPKAATRRSHRGARQDRRALRHRGRDPRPLLPTCAAGRGRREPSHSSRL